jgi:glycosyltransferase involved in cell wall biosynthesis
VPNVVVEPSFPPERPQTEAFRLFGLGALVPVKNPVLAIETVDWLRHQGHDVALRWAGDGPLSGALNEAIDRLDLRHEVRLLGQVAPDGLLEHFAWSTEFLLPTRHETFCVAAAEALAHGRPAVLGAVGGQRDFIDDEVGALVPHQTAEAYGQALVDVRQRLGALTPETLRRRVVTRFSPEAVVERFDEVYAGISSGEGRRARRSEV